jgi:hypothetical protein
MKKGLFVGVILVIGCVLLGVAQDKSKPAAKDAGKAPQAQSMPMPTPSPEMTKLIKSMAGTWTVTEKADPSPMMPKGGTGKGTATLTPGPGNLSLVEKYHSTGVMGGSFNGMGVFWWDPKAGAYRGVWCDAMTPTGCDANGTTKWDGDKLVGMMEGDMGGQKMVTRFTYSDWKPTSFVMTMESGPNANSLQKMMTITYSKGAAMAKTEKAAAQ